MKVRAFFMLTMVLLGSPLFAADAPKTIRFTISPETTVFTEPLLPDGRVDYYAAMNQKYSYGITKENNFMTGMFLLLPGELEYPLIRARIDNEPVEENAYQNVARKKYWNLLGYDNPPPLDSLQTVFPPQSESLKNILESWLKIHTPEEIIAKLPEEQKPKEKVDPLEFLKKMDPWALRVLMNMESGKTHQAFWTEKDVPLMKEWLETTPDLEKQLIDISRRPKYFNPIYTTSETEQSLVYAPLPSMQASRETARFLSSWGNYHFPRGEYDEAFECALASKRYGCTMRTNSMFLVEELVGNAIEGIALDRFVAYLGAFEGKKDANWILEKKQEFIKTEKEIPLPQIPKSFLGERCMALSTLQELSVISAKDFYKEFVEEYNSPEDLQESKEINDKFKELVDSKAAELDWDKIFRIINAHYDEIEDCFALPERWRQLRATERIEQRSIALKEELIKRNPDDDPEQFIADYLINLLSPAARACVGAFTRTECISRMVELTFSLAAYRAEHGKYPEKLEELLPKYMQEIPISPYTEQPLRYLNRTDEILITGGNDYILDGSDDALEKRIQEAKQENECFVHPKIPGSPIVIIKPRN